MRLVVDYATAMQSTMEPSRVATNRTASTCRPWGKEEVEEVEETNLSIDATVAFGNSFRISFAASASSLSLCLFLILFAIIIIIIFMQFGIFFWFLFFCFSSQISGQTLRLSAGVEVQANEWHPQRLMSLMVLLAKCRQTLAELIRIRTVFELGVRVRIS